MKVQTQIKPHFMTAIALSATVLMISAVSGSAFAATERKSAQEVEIKIEPISQSNDESVKSQVDRMSAVNRALEQALAERAKSQTAFERHNERLASRPEVSDRELRSIESNLDTESRETRAQSIRDNREDQRREKRLNWLND
jgi:septal ring factor EnvC (AmiA/AmiB activator)